MNLIKFSIILVTFPIYMIGNVTFISCKKMEDQTILSQNSEPFIIDSNKPSNKIKLSIVKEFNNVRGDILLELSKIELKEAPDGVYELYIGANENDLEFVELLDLYTIQAKENAKLLFSIKTLFDSRKIKDNIFIKVSFKGNILEDKTESKKAGYLKISSFKIITAE